MAQSSNRKVFLTGATGDTGSQALRLLEDAKVNVRVMCRRQAQVDGLISRGTDAVHCSLDDSISDLTGQMNGCDTLLLLTPAVPNQLQHNVNAIDAALAAGVTWIVRLSAGDARDEGTVPWVRAHAEADRYLEAKCEEHGISWTTLGASAFMQNILGEAPAIRKGFLPQTSGKGRAGWIDTSDIALFICRLVTDTPISSSNPHDKKTYILTGPALINMPEMADTLSTVLSHRVRYLHLPGPVFGLILRASGMDSWMANGIVAQFVEIVRPDLEGIDVSSDIETITGKRPVDFAEFVERNKDTLKGRDVGPWIGAGLIGVLGVGIGLALRFGRR